MRQGKTLKAFNKISMLFNFYQVIRGKKVMVTLSSRIIAAFTFNMLLATCAFAKDELVLEIDSSAPVAKIQPTMYGIFYEDINFSADGGLYAEMVKNRSFEFDQPLMGWTQPQTAPYSSNLNSGIAHTMSYANNVNKSILRVNVFNGNNYSIVNEGFRGMGVVKGKDYLLSFYAANADVNIKTITFQLIDPKDNVIATADIDPQVKDWNQYTATLTANKTEEKARLKITFKGQGTIDLDMISLFPRDTWNGRAKGLRKDLVEVIADLKPGFLRFPGGCIIEGRTLAQRYQWKQTIGAIEQRSTMISRWNTEFSHKLTPDYFQSFGLGFYEYFQLAEDLGAEPIPVVSCGIACQFNTGEIVPLSEMDPYIQDALDLIEFANGSTDTPWGMVRASMGHPEKFNLKYLGIGNEQWGPQYIERFSLFQKALKEKHPEIILISSSGPFPDGELFDYAHKELKKLDAEIIDEHYYKDMAWFKQNATRYDSYDRNGPKIFAGEYAAQSVAIVSPKNKNSWETALVEAAFMTGLERNADIVQMTSYAPLMAHVDAWQWSPNMIWFNNLEVLRTANYQVQKLFSNNAGTDLLRVSANKESLTGQNGIYASAVKDSVKKSVIVKIVNTKNAERTIKINAKNSVLNAPVSITSLASDQLNKENTFSNPSALLPKTDIKTLDSELLTLTLPKNSFLVVQIPINE
jgi:alpha-N-arabinofuranosidase